jgi:SRSO17 transposase
LRKQGRQAVGGARQESGTAGRVAHGQRGGLLTDASAQGHVWLDRARSLPQEWTHDPARCAGAGMPPARSLATKPSRARQRLERALDAAVPAAWVAGDRVYGAHRPLREWLAERAQA